LIAAGGTIAVAVINALGGKIPADGDLPEVPADDPNANLILPVIEQPFYITYQTPLIIGGVVLAIGGVLLLFKKEIFGK
jgi:hypothetical protein